MNKNIFLIVAAIFLLSCSSSDNNENSTNVTHEVKEPEKKEVVKDYDYYLKRIGNDKEWMAIIEEKAKESGLSVDSCLSKEAYDWGFKQKVGAELYHQIVKIKNNPEWMQKIKNQSLERGISVDSMLIIEAKFINK